MKKNTFYTNGTEVFFAEGKQICKITPAKTATRGDDGKIFWIGRSAEACLVSLAPKGLKIVEAGQSFTNGKIVAISGTELAVEKMTVAGVDYKGYDLKVDELNYSEKISTGTMVFGQFGGVRVK